MSISLIPLFNNEENDMDKIETSKTIYLMAFRSSYGDKEYHRYVTDHAPAQGDDSVQIDSMDITFYDTATDAELDKGLIKSLEEKREIMRAAASAAITEVDEQIASLLALENKSEKS
jgi:hypothetical protein